MKATRRQALIAAVAVPAAAGIPAMARASSAVVIYDPGLSVQAPRGAIPIAGDPIRFAREVFSRGPALVLGISRHADALLIADVGREAGYRVVPAPASLGPHGWVLAPAGAP